MTGMDLSDAIRIAEKIKPWINRFPEWVAGLDVLTDLAREQQGKDKVRKSPLTELWEEMFGPVPEDKPEPEPEAPKSPGRNGLKSAFVDGWMAARVHYGWTGSDGVSGEKEHGAECTGPATVCTCNEPREQREAMDTAIRRYGAAKLAEPEAKRTSELDVIPWEDARKLPARSKFVSCDEYGMPFGGGAVNVVGGYASPPGDHEHALVLYRALAPKPVDTTRPVNGSDIDRLIEGSIVVRCEGPMDWTVVGEPFTIRNQGKAFGWFLVLHEQAKS